MQVEKFMPIFQNLIMWGEFFIQLGLKIILSQGPQSIKLHVLLHHHVKTWFQSKDWAILS